MNEILPHQIVKLHWFTLFSFKAVQGFRSRRRSRYHDVSLRHTVCAPFLKNILSLFQVALALLLQL